MHALQASSLRASPLNPLQKPNPHFPNVSRLQPRPTKKFSSNTASSPIVSAPKREKDPRKRVVITGMGLVSVLGNDVDAFYDKLLAGESGIGPIDRFDASKFPTRFAGQIRGFTSQGYIDGKKDKRLDDCLRYSLVVLCKFREELN